MSKEFERWWGSQELAAVPGLDPALVKRLCWEAWRVGREQLYEATAALRLQPLRS